MREARLVEVAVFPPGTCFGCGGVEGPMVDTMVDVIGEGRIYVCTRICLPAWAGLAAYATPDEWIAQNEWIKKQAARVTELEQELAFERDHKTVSVSDMLDLVDRRDTVSTPIGAQNTEEEGWFLERLVSEPYDPDAPKVVIPLLCSATRVDGTPCTAKALPGRDVCLAHSKTKAAA